MSRQESLYPQFVRPIAICVIRKDNLILVAEGYDPIKDQVFYRPLGGTIEFGEYSRDTVGRELMEEIGAEIEDIRHLGVVENVFTYHGRPGHEVVFIYEGSFVDTSFYERAEIEGHEGQHTFKVVWKPVDGFDENGTPLYPEGLIEMLVAETSDR